MHTFAGSCQDSLLERILERVGKSQESPGNAYELADASRNTSKDKMRMLRGEKTGIGKTRDLGMLRVSES